MAEFFRGLIEGEAHATTDVENMMRPAVTARFALHRVDAVTWEIRDARLPTYAARTIAHIAIADNDEVEVIWSAPLPLPTTYATPSDALHSLEHWSDSAPGSTKPVFIPAFPPPAR